MKISEIIFCQLANKIQVKINHFT